MGYVGTAQITLSFLPVFNGKIQGITVESFVEEAKDSLGITNTEIVRNRYLLWVNAWFGLVSESHGETVLLPCRWEWHEGWFAVNHIARGTRAGIALYDLRMKAES